MRSSSGKSILNTFLLVFAAFLWGFTFPFQSIATKYVGPFTFMACRSWIAVAFLMPAVKAVDAVNVRRSGKNQAPQNHEQKRMLRIGGIACGASMCAASLFQQAGIAITTTAKASFITALYVVLVPILSIFLHQNQEKKLWFCVLLSVLGLYLLCFKQGSLEGLGVGDILMLFAALVYAIQILIVNHFAPFVDPVRLTQREMLTAAAITSVSMLLIEQPSAAALRHAAFPIFFAGVISSGVAYTLQIVCQTDLDPTIASLAMCLESVFGAIGGWVIQGQTLSPREIAGCALMFSAIVLSQISIPGKKKKKAA